MQEEALKEQQEKQEALDSHKMLANLSHDQIEAIRLQLIKGDHPELAELFDHEDIKESLKDPVKFRDSMKAGLKGRLERMTGDGDEL